MRARSLCLLLVCLAVAPAAAQPPLKVAYDAEHLDLDKHVLQFKPSRAATTADLVVLGESGDEIAKASQTYDKTSANRWSSITWEQPADARVMMLKLRVATADGAAMNLELIPWSVAVDHEDVTFATDSAAIEPAEQAKLDASLTAIDAIVKRSAKFLKLQLYIAGHTDTVGASAKNRTLSLARARAIAAYFRRKGLALPIAYAGYGEDVLKVKTADSTDEVRNRRADYVLGPVKGAPPFKGPYARVKTAWKALP